MDRLTEAEWHALRMFDGHAAGSLEIESIEEEAGKACIRAGLVVIGGGLANPRLRFALTPAGRAGLSMDERADG